MLTFDAEALRKMIREELAAALAKSPPAAAAPPPPDPANFSDADLGKRWKRSQTTIKALRRDGALRSVKFGSRWITPLAEVQRIEAAGLPSIGSGGRPKPNAPGVARPLFGKARP